MRISFICSCVKLFAKCHWPCLANIHSLFPFLLSHLHLHCWDRNVKSLTMVCLAYYNLLPMASLHPACVSAMYPAYCCLINYWQALLWTFVFCGLKLIFFWDKGPGMWINIGFMVCFFKYKIAKLLYTVAIPSCTAHSNVRESQLLCIPTSIWCCRISLNVSYSYGVW